MFLYRAASTSGGKSTVSRSKLMRWRRWYSLVDEGDSVRLCRSERKDREEWDSCQDEHDDYEHGLPLCAASAKRMVDTGWIRSISVLLFILSGCLCTWWSLVFVMHNDLLLTDPAQFRDLHVVQGVASLVATEPSRYERESGYSVVLVFHQSAILGVGMSADSNAGPKRTVVHWTWNEDAEWGKGMVRVVSCHLPQGGVRGSL